MSNRQNGPAHFCQVCNRFGMRNYVNLELYINYVQYVWEQWHSVVNVFD